MAFSATVGLALVSIGILLAISDTDAVLCYQCVSTQPGCGTPFDWRWHTPRTCVKCVKIIERKGSEEVITRNCLEVLQMSRRDIPADQYEGCRSAVPDPKLAHYVNHSIVENDVRRSYYDNTTWCFCEFDHWCNKGSSQISSLSLVGTMIAVALYGVLGRM